MSNAGHSRYVTGATQDVEGGIPGWQLGEGGGGMSKLFLYRIFYRVHLTTTPAPPPPPGHGFSLQKTANLKDLVISKVQGQARQKVCNLIRNIRKLKYRTEIVF